MAGGDKQNHHGDGHAEVKSDRHQHENYDFFPAPERADVFRKLQQRCFFRRRNWRRDRRRTGGSGGGVKSEADILAPALSAIAFNERRREQRHHDFMVSGNGDSF